MKKKYFNPTSDIQIWAMLSSVCEATGTPMSGGGDKEGGGEAPARRLYL